MLRLYIKLKLYVVHYLKDENTTCVLDEAAQSLNRPLVEKAIICHYYI